MEKQEIINSLNAGGKFTVSEDGRHIAFKTSGRRGDSIHVGHYKPSTTAGAVAEAEIIKLAVSEQSGGHLILALAEHPRETLPTGKAAREKMRICNNIHNEGGEGFVPYVDSQDDYDCRQNELAELSK